MLFRHGVPTLIICTNNSLCLTADVPQGISLCGMMYAPRSLSTHKRDPSLELSDGKKTIKPLDDYA
jgi:hypothetical protein